MSGVENRIDSLYKLIDSDDSGFVNKRELEQLLVQGGSTTASASESMDNIFNQAKFEGIKRVDLSQFKTLFTNEQVLKPTPFFFPFLHVCVFFFFLSNIYTHIKII